MATFSPPVDNIVPPFYLTDSDPTYEVNPLAQRLMRHYRSGPRGRNVFLMMDGSFSETQPPNWDPNNPTAPFSTTYVAFNNTVLTQTNPPSQQVKRIYWGGVANPVTAAEAAALTAAGYVVTP